MPPFLRRLPPPPPFPASPVPPFRSPPPGEWVRVRVTGTTTFGAYAYAAYTAQEVRLEAAGSWQATTGGVVITADAPAIPVAGAPSVGDYGWARPAPNAPGAAWELVPDGSSGSSAGFFARLTSSGSNASGYGTAWKYVKQEYYDSAGYGWHDTGSESADYVAFPSTIDGTNTCNPAAGLRVWMMPSARLSGCYEFLPVGYADATHPGLVSITTQEFSGYKTFLDKIKVGTDSHDPESGGIVASNPVEIYSDGNAVTAYTAFYGSPSLKASNGAWFNYYAVCTDPATGYQAFITTTAPAGGGPGLALTSDSGGAIGVYVPTAANNLEATGLYKELWLYNPATNGIIVAVATAYAIAKSAGAALIGQDGSFPDNNGVMRKFVGGIYVGVDGS